MPFSKQSSPGAFRVCGIWRELNLGEVILAGIASWTLQPGLESYYQAASFQLSQSTLSYGDASPSTFPASVQAHSLLNLHLGSLKALLWKAGGQQARKDSWRDENSSV